MEHLWNVPTVGVRSTVPPAAGIDMQGTGGFVSPVRSSAAGNMTGMRIVGSFLQTLRVYSWTGNTKYVEARPERKSSMRRKAVVLAFFSFAFAVPAQGEAPYGRADYVRYCSACHGELADGKGPVANVLTPSPPALTRLRAKYGRPLGTSLVAYVMGDTMPRAHGTSDMPVWGRDLKAPDGGDMDVVGTIWRITTYLESIQGVAPKR